MAGGYDVDGNLAHSDPGAGGRLWGPDSPAQADADQITIEQRRLAVALMHELAGERYDLADRIVKGLIPTDVWQTFGMTQSESPKMIRIEEIERGGVWKVAGVLALPDPGNTADVTVAIDGLASFPIRVTARRTDPVEATPNVPVRTLDGTANITIAGGAGADKLVLYLRLQRSGARIGRG